MEQRQLGPLQVSVLGLGTMTFGAEADEATSHGILDHFVDAGGSFIDTADVYAQGASEVIIGRWLDRRGGHEDVVIATKARFPMGDDPRESGAGRAYLTRALDASLGRLGVDPIDLYQVHAWDPATPIEETLETLNGFVEAGKVRTLGVSNYLAYQLERAILTAECRGWAPIESLQSQYNLLERTIEHELLPLALERNIGLMPWSPLGGGWLSGKYSATDRPTGETRLGEDPTRGVEAYDLRNNERTWRVLAEVEHVAANHGASMSQVALNWLMGRPAVSSVLLGCRTVTQLADNLGTCSWELTAEETRALDLVSAPGIPTYPHGFLESYAGIDVWDRLTTRAEPIL